MVLDRLQAQGGVWVSVSVMGRDAALARAGFWGGGLRHRGLQLRGVGGMARAKGLSPAAPQPQPRGAGLAAGRLQCGHIWGAAAGLGPEWVTWHRAGPPWSLQGRGWGGAGRNMPEGNACQLGYTLFCSVDVHAGQPLLQEPTPWSLGALRPPHCVIWRKLPNGSRIRWPKLSRGQDSTYRPQHRCFSVRAFTECLPVQTLQQAPHDSAPSCGPCTPALTHLG